MYKIIVERLRALKGDMSVSAFARTLEMGQKTIDTYIKGERKPSVELIKRVCSKYGVSADWLLGLSDVRTPVKEAAPPVATPPAVPATTAAKRPKNCPGAKYPDPNAALLVEVRELTARVKALEAAASKPAFACG